MKDLLWFIALWALLTAIGLFLVSRLTSPAHYAFKDCPWSASPLHRQPLKTYYV